MVQIPILPRENVFGHTRKVQLLRDACARLHDARATLRILDVGCGSGYAVTRYLGEPQDEVLGIDPYAPNIEYANRTFARAGLRFECRSAESLVSAQLQFDVIVLADVLEHLDQPGLILTECRRLLAPAGLLLISVPNGHGPFELESALSRIRWLGPSLLKLTEYFVAALNKYGPLRGRWTRALADIPPGLPYNAESGHVNFFTRRSLDALLAGAGFSVQRRGNLSFFSGPFTNFLVAAFPGFIAWNVACAQKVPARLVSGWFVECAASVRAPA